MHERYTHMYDEKGNLREHYASSGAYANFPRRITVGGPAPVSTIIPSETLNSLTVTGEVRQDPYPGIPAHKFLEDASSTMKQRAQLRDKPEGERSMATIVNAFNAYSGKDLSEADGWAFMIFLKMVRGKQGSFHADDYVDGAAYFGLLGECESKNRS